MDEPPSQIPTPPRLRVFVSSRMQELAPERAALKAVLAAQGIDSFVFEDDAGARPQGIRDTYLDEIEASDLYLGIFWRGYGAYTIEEFDHATALGFDCLVYEKHTGERREPALQDFLDRISHVETGAVTPDRFATVDDLERKVVAAVALWRQGFDAERHRRSCEAVVYGVPARPPPYFIGREGVLAECAARLRAGDNVALEGLPGAGKTTLATALVRHRGVERRFRDGVLWASLGPQANAAAVLLEWAEAIDPKGELAREVGQAMQLAAQSAVLQDALANRTMLIVIDDAWETEAALALRCGGPRCAHLLTTRDKGIAREVLRHAGSTAVAELDEETAFALLQRLAPEACAAHETAARALVRAVGGLPQAVRLMGGQLATAQAGMFASVFPELGDDAFEELTNPAERLRLAEQRLGARGQAAISLQDTVLMSLQGLPEEARAAFFALGAFAPKPERFDRAAAEAVTRAAPRMLALLAARHLLEVETTSAGLALHPTIADVARTQTNSGAVEAHVEHHLKAAVDAADDWRRVQALYGQLRWAWKQATGDVPFALLAGLERFQQRRGLVAERLEWARHCLELAQARSLGPVAESRLHRIIGHQLGLAGRHDEAVASLRRHHALALKLDTPQTGIDASFELAVALSRTQAAEPALALLTDAAAKAREVGDRRREAEGLMIKGLVLRNASQLVEALEQVLRALDMLREIGDRPNEADAHGLVASIYQRATLDGRALEHLEQALTLRRSLSQAEAEGELQTGVALVHLGAGRLESATEVANQALAVAESSGNVLGQIEALDLLGDIQLAGGEVDAALASYQRELQMAQEVGLDAKAATAHESIGLALERRGQTALALEAAAQALALRRATGNLPGQARLLGVMARHHARLVQPEAMVRRHAEAWSCWRSTDDPAAQARALDTLARSPLAIEPLAARVQALDFVLAALHAAPADVSAAQALARLSRRRDDVRRYGAALLHRRALVPPVEVWVESPPGPPGALADALKDACLGLSLTYGWIFPPIALRTGFAGRAPNEAALVIAGTERAVLRAEDGANVPESLAHKVADVLQRHLADFVGHDELMLELAAQPAVVERLRASPVEASILVAVLHTLLDERVPVLELPAIVRCFESMRLAGADRLAIVAAVRQLPAVRPLLPGNEPGCRYLHLAVHWQEQIAASVRMEKALPYAAMQPGQTQALLASLRAALSGFPELQHCALLVDDSAVRRYVQRIAQLEYARLAVLARNELALPADGRVVAEVG